MSEENEQSDFPPKLAESIRQAYAHRRTVPAEKSRFILSAARARFAQRRRMRLVLRWGSGVAAAAAVIVMAVVVHRPAATRATADGDINGDGRRNIVDALALAKHLAAHDRMEKAWDVNGDGVVDQKDVDALAMAAVSLQQGDRAALRIGKPEAFAQAIPAVGWEGAR